MSPSFTHALSVGLTLLVLLVGYHVVQRLIDGLVHRLGARLGDTARSRTLGSLLTSVVRWVLAFVVLVVILRELGIDVQAIVVSAGVLGVVVGLGAQALIRDLLTGIFFCSSRAWSPSVTSSRSALSPAPWSRSGCA
jgi:moderate conductance mechanosensitive channel